MRDVTKAWTSVTADSESSDHRTRYSWLPVSEVMCRRGCTSSCKVSSTVSTVELTDLNPELTMHYLEVWQTKLDGCSLLINCTQLNLTLVTAMSHISVVVMLWF